MPGPGDPVLVDEREPALPDDLGVIARDRVAPPGLLDPPSVADLDRFASAVPADRHEPALGIELDIDARMFAQEPGHAAGPPRPSSANPTDCHLQRSSGNGASGSLMAT